MSSTRILQAGSVSAALAVAALGLPWWSTAVTAVPLDDIVDWHATTLLGVRLVGGVPSLVLVALAVCAALAVRLPAPLHAAAVAAAGGASVAAGAGVLAQQGALLPGPWLTTAAGSAAVLTSLTGSRRFVAAVAAALPVPLVLHLLATGPQPRAEGPFVRLAPLTSEGTLESGAVALAGPAGAALAVPVAGTVGYAGPGGIATVGPDGRVELRAAADGGFPDRDPYPITGIVAPGPSPLGTVVSWTGPDTLTVRGVDRDASVHVTGVDLATRPGTDGSVWLRTTDDGPGPDVMRRLDPQALLESAPRAATVPATDLPRPATSPGLDDADPFALLPVPGGLLALGGVEGEWRLRHYGPEAPVDLPACVVSGGRLAADHDGVWFTQGRADGNRLMHLAADGTLTTVPDRLPGRVESLTVATDGTLGLLVGPVGDGPGLWTLDRPLDHLVASPCAA
ncbi:hypothetical protein [Pseudonocardia xishanensis]|uniref:Uncharacterized protein n=1 Tax=Pseudonocardia xishanensis TaxID=630995 RepID=A0ABP8RYQ5_9PSEU